MKLKEFWRRVRRYFERQLDILFEDIAPEVPDAPAEAAPPGEEEPPPTPAPEEPAPAGPAPALEWRYGGFDGSRAVEDPECRIVSASMNRDRVTFRFSGPWWGATHENPTMRCCIFFKDPSGAWRGGFWEWGSPDRTTRDFANIADGYNGWSHAAFLAASEYLVLVCDRRGSRRSNIVFLKP